MRNMLKLLLLPVVILTMSNCKEDIKEVIDEISFTVTVVNNTADELTVFWNVDNKGFEEVGKVAGNGGTLECGPVTINVDNVFEVRKADGTVVATGSYNQPDTTDRVLTVE